MAFAQINELPQNPPLRIFFHGLVILRSNDGRSCLAEIHREASTHSLSIEVRTKTPNQPDLILLRYLKKLPGGNDHLRLSVDPAMPVAQQRAAKYVRFNVDPFNTAPTDANATDFGWVADLARGHYHGRGIGMKTSGTRAGVLIEGGDCRFYTASLLARRIPVMKGGNSHGTLQGLAALVGANLYYGGDRKVLITLPGGGTLPLPVPSNGVSYEVYIENSPPFADAEHDELEEYYKVLRKVRDDSGQKFDEDEQFRFDLHPDPDFTGSVKIQAERGSARIPCQSITLDGD